LVIAEMLDGVTATAASRNTTPLARCRAQSLRAVVPGFFEHWREWNAGDAQAA
jgi:hypothetical protein